jgi:hypothetical protein
LDFNEKISFCILSVLFGPDFILLVGPSSPPQCSDFLRSGRLRSPLLVRASRAFLDLVPRACCLTRTGLPPSVNSAFFVFAVGTARFGRV